MNERKIKKEEYLEILSDILESNRITIPCGGASMFPLLREGDMLILKKEHSHLIQKGDIIAFTNTHKNIGHRVISIRKQNGSFVFTTRGDNCRKADPPVPESDIIGKVTGFSRNGKDYSLESNQFRLWTFVILYLGFLIRPLIFITFRMHHIYQKSIAASKTLVSNLRIIITNSERLMVWNIIFSLFQGLLPFATIYMIKRLVDGINKLQSASNQHSVSHIEVLIGITGIFFLFTIIINSLSSFYREKLSQTISLEIYNLLHTKHSRLAFSYLENAEQQEKIHRATVEAGFRPMKLIGAALSLIKSVCAGIVVVILMASIHWAIIVILFVGLLPGLFVRFKFSRQMYHLNKKNSTKERQSFYYNRVITGNPFAKELRLFAVSELFISLFRNIQIELNTEKNKLYRKHIVAELLSQTIAIIVIFTAFGFVTSLALHGNVSIGSVVLFFMVFQRGFAIIKDLFQSIATLYEDNIFFEDFISFLQLPTIPEHTDNRTSTVKKNLEQGIRIENVSFQYPASTRQALHNVSVTIPAGKTIALVGANGSGKTTLIKLLCGFYQPDEGSISFDDKQLSNENQDSIRKHITAVFQDFALYNMTAEENIRIGNTTTPIDIEKIKHSCEMAGIADTLEQLPEGYKNMIGNYFEKGEELSIGQWQKMAIARAFYRDSPVVLMDEPSSALDAETEHHVIDCLQKLASNKTVLLISHRFSAIQWVDEIFVMSGGTIAEHGTHEQLLTQKGLYYTMFMSQKQI